MHTYIMRVSFLVHNAYIACMSIALFFIDSNNTSIPVHAWSLTHSFSSSVIAYSSLYAEALHSVISLSTNWENTDICVHSLQRQMLLILQDGVSWIQGSVYL